MCGLKIIFRCKDRVLPPYKGTTNVESKETNEEKVSIFAKNHLFCVKFLHQDYENICADYDYNIRLPQHRVR